MLVNPSGPAILLVLGRSNRDRASAPIDATIDLLRCAGLTVHHDDPRPTTRWAQAKARARRCESALIPGALSVLWWLTYRLHSVTAVPFRFAPWGLDELSRDASAVRARVRHLRRVIAGFGPGAQVFILAHSAGGRVASRLSGCETVRAAACFGYPFRHPNRREEPARTRGLRDLRLPFLIVQGRDDPYGGEAALPRYRLSPSVSVLIVDSDHEYDMLTAQDRARVQAQVLRHFGLAAPSSQECSGPSSGNFLA